MEGVASVLCALVWALSCPGASADVDIELAFAVQAPPSTPNSTSNHTNASAFSLSHFIQAIGQRMPTRFNVTNGNTTELFELSRPLAVQSVKTAQILCVGGNCYDEAVYGNPPATSPTPPPPPAPLPQEAAGPGPPVVAIVVSVVSFLVVLLLILLWRRRIGRRKQTLSRSWYGPSGDGCVEFRPIIKARITLPLAVKTGAQTVGGFSYPPHLVPA